MRIAIFIPGFQSSPQDWCIPAFTNLARGLATRAEVDIFALRYPQRRSTYAVGSVKVHPIGRGSMYRWRIPGLSLVKLWRDTLLRFDHEHRRKPYDAILAFWATESGALAIQAGQRWGLPVLVHLAGGELVWQPPIRYGNWHQGLAGALVSASLRGANLITVPSGQMRSLLSGRAPSAAARAVFWPLGVDTTMFKPPEKSEPRNGDPFIFISVASLLPVKGLDVLVRATAEVRRRRPDLRFQVRIVGEGHCRSRLEEIVRTLDLKGYVVLPGPVSHDALPALYGSASCFVSSSTHEAQCMALLEAASCGLPWISTRVGAALDLASHGKRTGLLVGDSRPETLAEAMCHIMDLPHEDLGSMGNEARKRILAGYELQTQCSQLLEHLNTLTLLYRPLRMKVVPPGSVTRCVLSLVRDVAISVLRDIPR